MKNHQTTNSNHKKASLRYAVYNKRDQLVDLVRIVGCSAHSLAYSDRKGFKQSAYFNGTEPILNNGHSFQLICARADWPPWQDLVDGIDKIEQRGRPLREPVTPDQKLRILELRANEMSIRAIAALLDINKSTVGRVLKASH